MINKASNKKNWRTKIAKVFQQTPKNRPQLISLLKTIKDKQVITSDAMRMIERVLKVSDMKVRDAMIPRSQMVVIEEQATFKEALPIMTESAHSRFPVIHEESREVIGVLMAKDLLQFFFDQHPKQLKIFDLIRPAVFIPESKRLDVLLKEFRLNRNHMAIVVDEYGSASGLITIEDVLEEIVGEIEDEYDFPESDGHIKQVDEQNFLVNALTPIEEFNAFFDTKFIDDHFDTIGGIVLQKFSHLPKRGESVEIDNLKVTVTQTGHRNIELLRITKIPPNENND